MPSDRIRSLADRLSNDPYFIAGHISRRALIAALGCDDDTAVSVRLCRWPVTQRDYRQIADRHGLDVDALTAALAGK